MIDQLALRKNILAYFRKQGFKYNPHVRPANDDKETYRNLQRHSRLEQINLHKKSLSDTFKTIRPHLRSGTDIEPQKISLKLIEVRADTKESAIFNWWNLIWWNVPYQQHYGRLMRYIVWDETHDAPFGLISLQSPVLRMSVRDNYLEIPRDELDIWVNRSLQAQRLGAIPPYNHLLGSKMCALSIVCDEIRHRYAEKYEHTTTLMKQRVISNDLLFLTTTSAFGRSSVYNRLKHGEERVAISLGYTKGSGSFHISEKLYKDIVTLLDEKGFATAREYGNGPSRKMKLIEKGLGILGIKNGIYHNIPREFFLFPLVSNLRAVINVGESPNYIDRSFSELFGEWHKRYCLPRSERDQAWMTFDSAAFLKEVTDKYAL